jgi:hypothetical protein
MAPHDEKPSLLKSFLSAFGRISQEKREIFSMRSTVVTVKINGVEQRIDASGGLNEALIRQVASQAGIPLDQVMDLLHSSGALASLQQASQSNQTGQVTRTISMTECTKCHRKVPQTAKCLYCGQALQQTVAAKETTNEVDKKFLEADVAEENKTKEKQQIRDTFEDRLKNL